MLPASNGTARANRANTSGAAAHDGSPLVRDGSWMTGTGGVSSLVRPENFEHVFDNLL